MTVDNRGYIGDLDLGGSQAAPIRNPTPRGNTTVVAVPQW